MKHFKDSNNNLYGFEDGTETPIGLVEISKAEADQIGIVNFAKQQEDEIAKMDYVRQRLTSYPELGKFVDAWVKNDQIALEEYRQECLAVKTKYPKPVGF